MNLQKTSKDYYDTLREVPKGMRMTTAAEELEIAQNIKTQEDIKRVYFYPDGSWAWIWTSIALKARDNKFKIPEIEKNGMKYWKRILVIGDKEMGTVLVPEGNGKIVSKWDKKTGLPLETIEDTKENRKGIHTHFWFSPGMEGVAVGRSCGWPLDEGCLYVDMSSGRWDVSSDDGFRPVRDSIKEEKHKHKFMCECGKIKVD